MKKLMVFITGITLCLGLSLTPTVVAASPNETLSTSGAESKINITLKDSQVNVGTSWEASNNFVKISMPDGKELAWNDVAKEIIVTGDSGTNITGQVVNTDKVGIYQVNYLYQGQTATAKVTVIDKKEPGIVKKIELKDITLDVGSKWDASNNFIKVVLSDGKELTWDDVAKEIIVTGNPETNVTGQVVNTDKVGTYQVTYLYQGQTATAKITITDKKIPIIVKQIELKDTTLEVGSNWDASQNFVKVTMSDGKNLAWKEVANDMIVTGNPGTNVTGQVVNTDKVGTYQVTYLYQGQTATAKVTVTEKTVPVMVQKIELKNITLEIGSNWEASHNFVKVIMSDGKELTWNDVANDMIVTGNPGTNITGQVVNTEKAGTYQVDYLYQGQTATATVTITNKVVPVKPTDKKLAPQQLPQTSEKMEISTILLGFALLAATFTIVVAKAKKLDRK